MKWNWEKLPQRDLVFCEGSQKPAGGVEIVEFHVVRILYFLVSDIIVCSSFKMETK